MLLLCVCWWKWCDVDPTMLLLLLELVELLSGLGVAIVVLDSGSSAQAAMQSETSPSLPPDGTLRHLNAAAAPRPRLCRCCLHGLSEIQEITLHIAVLHIFHSLLYHVFKSVHILFHTSLYLIIFPQFSPMWFNKIVKNTKVGKLL